MSQVERWSRSGRSACAAHQGHDIGHALMHGAVGAADALDEQAIVHLGHPGFYGRFGFVGAEPLGIMPPDPAWGRHSLARPLTAWDGSLHGGFRYAPAFDQTSAPPPGRRRS